MKTFLCLLFCFLSFQLFAQSIPTKPEPAIFVNDFAKIFSATELSALEQKLKSYNDSTSTQIVIATVQNLQGIGIKDFANAWARNWGIGQKDKDNGILILFTQEERKIRIETGYGLEGVLPDAVCMQIIENQMIPNFKKGNFYNGFEEATSEIIFRLKGEFQQDTSKLKEYSSSYWELLKIFGLSGIIGAMFYNLILSIFINFKSLKKKADGLWLFLLISTFPFGFVIYLINICQMYYNTNAVLIGLAVAFFVSLIAWAIEYSESGGRGGNTYSSSSNYYSSSSSSDSSSSWSDSSSSSSDSSFGGGDFGGGGADSSW